MSTNQFKNGITIEHEGNLFDLVEFQFVKPGKGSAFVRTRLKNIRTGKVLEVTFDSKDTIEQVSVEKNDMEYLYREGEHYIFMDPDTYDQVPVAKEKVEDLLPLLKENTKCFFKRVGDEIISIALPDFVILEVVETDRYIKGSTASGGPKPAKVETGAIVSVPVFVEVGDVIKVDTRTRAYVERV
ncbi:MAG: elongation factor P [Planctomycetes bacterium]|nr:elongation factor P [Planctomycetota bacterium]